MKRTLVLPYVAARPLRHERSSGAGLLARLWRWLFDRRPASHESAVPAAPVLPGRPAARPPARPPETPGQPVARAVPVPIDALTRLLNRDPRARARLRHLALVESSCLMSPAEPFARLPPRAIAIAVRQLDAVLPLHPSLRVLRLQLERHLQAHQARLAAVLASEDMKWQLDHGVPALSAGLAPDSMIGGAWGVTDFLETMPLDRNSLAGAQPA
jgi:hypothetical protein